MNKQRVFFIVLVLLSIETPIVTLTSRSDGRKLDFEVRGGTPIPPRTLWSNRTVPGCIRARP